MAAQDAETATNLVQDCLEAASKGIQDFTGKKDYKFLGPAWKCLWISRNPKSYKPIQNAS